MIAKRQDFDSIMNKYLKMRFPGEPSFQRVLYLAFVVSILYGTAMASIRGITIGGKELRGWTWVIQGFLAILVILISDKKQNPFPIGIWVPWLLWILIRCDWNYSVSVQRTLTLATCIPVAAAASKIIINKDNLGWVLKSLVPVTLIICAVMLLDMFDMLPLGLAYQGAGSSMTLCLIAFYYAIYVYELDLRKILLWLACISSNALSGLRTVTAASILSLVLLPMPLREQKRITAFLVSLFLVVLVFSLPVIDQKMSKSGEGLMYIVQNPGELHTSGRAELWPMLLEEAWKHPFLGGGGSSSEVYISAYGISGHGGHPHNEYIRVFFDFGIVGLVLLGFPVIYTIIVSWRSIRNSRSEPERDGWIISCGGMISMLIISLTDNVLLYTAFFGNLLFFIIGASFSVSTRRILAGN